MKIFVPICTVNSRCKVLSAFLLMLIRGNKVVPKFQRKTHVSLFTISETVLQLARTFIPFSGIGKLHGKRGLLVFSDQKSVLILKWRVSFTLAQMPNALSTF